MSGRKREDERMTADEYEDRRLYISHCVEELDAAQARVDSEAPGSVEQLQVTVATRDGMAALIAELADLRRRALEAMPTWTAAIH